MLRVSGRETPWAQQLRSLEEAQAGVHLGLLVFGQLPAPVTWLGIALIVAGGLVLIERRPHAKGGAG